MLALRIAGRIPKRFAPSNGARETKNAIANGPGARDDGV